MKLSPRPKAVSCIPQQKAKDNRAAHRINKVQKVSGGQAGSCHPGPIAWHLLRAWGT